MLFQVKHLPFDAGGFSIVVGELIRQMGPFLASGASGTIDQIDWRENTRHLNSAAIKLLGPDQELKGSRWANACAKQMERLAAGKVSLNETKEPSCSYTSHPTFSVAT